MVVGPSEGTGRKERGEETTHAAARTSRCSRKRFSSISCLWMYAASIRAASCLMRACSIKRSCSAMAFFTSRSRT